MEIILLERFLVTRIDLASEAAAGCRQVKWPLEIADVVPKLKGETIGFSLQVDLGIWTPARVILQFTRIILLDIFRVTYIGLARQASCQPA